MSKLHDYQSSLPSCARCAFSDAAISLSIFFDINAEVYYYERYKFNLEFALNECCLTDEEKSRFDFYVREYARELNK